MSEGRLVKIAYLLPAKYWEDMKQAENDGDWSWVAELLDYAEMIDVSIHA